MVYTITCNPSLDYVMRTYTLRQGATNRSYGEKISAGGKGINVSVVLRRLGIETCALGFVAGFTGKEIVRLLREEGLRTDFFEIDGVSRINVKLKGGEETEINARGPEVREEDWQGLFGRLKCVRAGDIIVLAGNPAGGMRTESYADAVRFASKRDIPAVVDATREALRLTLPHRPFLIKPNRMELAELTGMPVVGRENCFAAAESLQREGARNVIVSLGGEGALFLTEDGRRYAAEVPSGKVIDTVGAGDSLVAGFLAGFLAGRTDEESFAQGVAAGCATAFSEGLADAAGVEALRQEIRVFRC